MVDSETVEVVLALIFLAMLVAGVIMAVYGVWIVISALPPPYRKGVQTIFIGLGIAALAIIFLKALAHSSPDNSKS